MRTGASLTLICIGAILAFAVTTNTSVFNIHIAGWVLMLVGAIGLCFPRRNSWLGRRMLVRRTRTWPPDRTGPPAERVEEIPVPPYVTQNPGIARERAGLPPTPSLLHQKKGATPVDTRNRPADKPGDTEVYEDLFEPPESPLEP